MAALPPPPNPSNDRPRPTPEQAARLERLARRRGDTPKTAGTSDLTPEQAARLERLAQRRGDAPTARTAGRSDLTPERAARLERLAQRSRPEAGSALDGRATRPRRHHPAKGARNAALGLSLATTAALAGVFASMNRSVSAESADSVATIVSSGSGATPSAGNATGTTGAASSTATPRTVIVPVPAPDATPQPSPTTSPSTTVAPAQPTVVDGAVFRNKWGPVQVEATFAPDGSLTDVVALQTPNDRGQSVSINNFAVPRLTTEALTAQSASVHTISGATYTSNGYRQSLQSAIDAARTAGVTSIA